MRQKFDRLRESADKVINEPRRATRKQYSAEERIRILLGGFARRGQHCRTVSAEGINRNLYYCWSKGLLEAGKKGPAGDTVCAATSDEVRGLRREAVDLKEVVGEMTPENRLLKKSMIGDGGDRSPGSAPLASLDF